MLPSTPTTTSTAWDGVRPIFATMAATVDRKQKRKRTLRKLWSKYRLLLINDNTFKESFSIRLTPVNVLLLLLGLLGTTAAITVLLIVFTPLKRYIPGYADADVRVNSYHAAVLADSLNREVRIQAAYTENLRRIFSGDLPPDSVKRPPRLTVPPDAAELAASHADSALRRRTMRNEAYALTEGMGAKRRELVGIVFFPPLRGVVTQRYARSEGHFGIDVATKADEPVKACLEGTVVQAAWTADGGNLLVVQHPGDLISVYKHNAVLLKKTGEPVRAGEAIAIVGDSGELTDGPHLHFELWLGGQPIDPQQYMVFQ
jgi:murein DD-endopeptidase MepM/ murein hydrolase activator NlpD